MIDKQHSNIIDFDSFQYDMLFLLQQPYNHRASAGRGKMDVAAFLIDDIKMTKQFRLYESDHTLFIKALKEKNPAIEEGQRAGRALLWDKAPISLDEQERQLKSAIKQQPYVYQNKI